MGSMINKLNDFKDMLAVYYGKKRDIEMPGKVNKKFKV